jgi:Zn-dependent oligopeptidase
MKLTQAKDSQAKEKNIPILESLVQKRNELAVLLNYTSFSAYSIDGLMAKTPETVQKFHDDLRMKITEKAKQEIYSINQIKSENMTEELPNPY